MSDLDTSTSIANQNPLTQWVVIITLITAFSFPIFFFIGKLRLRTASNTTTVVQPSLIQSPRRYIKKQQSQLLSPVYIPNSVCHDDNDDDFESDILNELDRYNATKGEKRDIEGLTASLISASTNTDSGMDGDQFEQIKSLEQDLSNQKLLNHYTEVKLQRKEKECEEIRISEKSARNKVHELMDEISSISKKNTDLMTYCENKVASCRVEYQKMSQKSSDTLEKTRGYEREITDLKNKLSDSVIYKNEYSKLRATISCLKSKNRDRDNEIEALKKENKELEDTIASQRHRLNESSKNLNKANDELVAYKRHKNNVTDYKDNVKEYKDKINELEYINEELSKENKDIKDQMDQFSQQLKQQSLMQNDMINIQQQLSIPNTQRSSFLLSAPRTDINSDSIDTTDIVNTVVIDSTDIVQ